MKKYFLSIVALAGMLFATSCQESLVEPQLAGPTTFSVQLPEQMGTKAIGDASSVTELLVDVYAQHGTAPIYQTKGTPNGNNGFDVQLNLIQDQSYDILFWAQTEDGYVEVNENDGSFGSLRSVPMNANFLNNDNGAAFFHAEKGFVPNGTSKDIVLVRPFAQLNLGTTDASLITNAGNFQLVSSSIRVTGMANQFNVFEGLGFDETVATYDYGTNGVPQEGLSVSGVQDPFNYVSMNYLAVLGNEKALVDVEASIVVKNIATNETQTIYHTFTNVPVQENYRTNIVGNLISSTTDFIVTVDNAFAEDDNENLLPDNDYYVVDNPAKAAEEFGKGQTHIAINYVKDGDELKIPDNAKETLYLQLPDVNAEFTVNVLHQNVKKLNITVPNTDESNVGLDLIVNAPNSTVEIKDSQLNTINGTTAQNTLILNGVTVNEVVVEQGNVVIENESEVNNLKNDSGSEIHVSVDATSDVVVDDSTKGVNLVDAANVSTIKELQQLINTLQAEEIVLGQALTNNVESTLDLKGKTIFFETAEQGVSMITNKSSLNISNGTILFNYKGEADSNYGTGNYTIANSGTLSLQNVNVRVVAEGVEGKFSHALYSINNGGTLTIDGGLIENNNNIAVRMINANSVVVNNAEIKGTRAFWIQLPSNNPSSAPEVNLTINSGVINGTGIGESNDNKLAIYSYSYGQDMQNVTININGGEIIGDVALTGGANKTNIETLNITGGTFNGKFGDVYSYGDEVAAAEKITITGGSFSSLLPIVYANDNETITLNSDVTCTDPVIVKDGSNVELNLNGKKITGVDNAEKSFGLITNHAKLTIVGPGTISLSATNNRGWNAYSSVISNQPGGNLTVGEGVVIEHLGGTDMAYGIDNLTNGKGTSAITTINGATVKSTYRAIRQFLNGIEATNELYVNAGSTILNTTGTNRGIWMQDPSKNANTGKLVVAEGAHVDDVYLSVTAGSTEWPVEVSIASSSLNQGKTVMSSNVPAGYGVILEKGIWKVEKNSDKYVFIGSAEQLIMASKQSFKGGQKVFLTNDIDLDGKEFTGLSALNSENNNTFDGQGYTISNWSYNGGASDMAFIKSWVGRIKNVNFENCHLKTAGRSAVVAANVYANIENVTVNNCSIEDSYWACGIIAGLYNSGSINNCVVTNSSVKSNGGTGGIVGVINETAGTRSLVNCSVSNSTIDNTGVYGEDYTGGGLIGMFNVGGATYKLVNCSVNENTLKGEHIYELCPEQDNLTIE